MKKIFTLILSVALCIVSLCACGDSYNNNNGKLSVVATIFPPYDFSRQIAGDKIDLTMLLRPGMESHDYDPTPQDIIKIQNADLFIYVGGESDEWVEELLGSADKKPKKAIALIDCVDAVEEETVEGMEQEKEEPEDSDEKEYDEHVWTSPVNAIEIVKSISESLQSLDKDNADTYKKNTADYCKRLSSLDAEFEDIVQNGKRNTIVFGDRFPFRYFTDRYGLEYSAAFPGCSSQTEPSAATVSYLIDKVNEEKIPVVFCIEFSGGKIADTICESTGAKKLEFHSCHNVTKQDFDNGVTYLQLMNNNKKVLREALA